LRSSSTWVFRATHRFSSGLAVLRAFLKERGHRGAHCGLDLTVAARSRFPSDRFETANLPALSNEELSNFIAATKGA
jgi:hypothetical protein